MFLDGPWMIGDNYLYVQRWKPNFRAHMEEINSLSVCAQFPFLLVEYYMEGWLKRVGNNIGRTIKVDIATLLASRGKFTGVCAEVDLQKPLMSEYRMHGDFWRLQYEGFHDSCFECGKYGHRALLCLIMETGEKGSTEAMRGVAERSESGPSGENANSRYGDWISVQQTSGIRQR